jgi:hypothetical protein
LENIFSNCTAILAAMMLEFKIKPLGLDDPNGLIAAKARYKESRCTPAIL